METPKPRYVAHRGLPRQFPDNSLAGILAAMPASEMIEIDVRRTADGVLVLAHDPEFAGLIVREHTLADLLARDVGGHKIARLDEVLEAVGDFPLNLEIKQNRDHQVFDPDPDIARQVGALARPGDLVTSFYWPTVAAVKVGFFDVKTGLLVDSRLGFDAALSEAGTMGHPVLAVHDPLLGEDPRPAMNRARSANLEVVVWTVNDPARARQLAEAGVSAIISDDPVSIRLT
jgi:glycerophosphoryl diester phosphodiesterase